MLNTLRKEDGMTLIEVLITSVLMLVILGVTLSTLNQFERNVKTNDLQNQAQDETRAAMDLMTRDLRNLASPTPDLPQAVDKATGQDVIFQAEGKEKPDSSLNAQNTTRVRYCLDTSSDSLYRQIQTWPTALAPAIPDTSKCPGAGWDLTRLVAGHVVNEGRAIFTFNSATPTEITEISSELFVDANPGIQPREVTLQSSVYLRNQNRAPTAGFSWASVESPGDVDNIFLNASGSTDPEERPMTYHWYDASLTDCTVQPPATGPAPETRPGCAIGEGILFTYTPPASGTRDIYLIVKDAALETEPLAETVCAPGPGELCTTP